MNSSSEPFDWLLENLEFDANLFHVGRYCGNWQASTQGLARASFHLLAHGDCWLHLDDQEQGIALHAGDALFLLRDLPYRLSDTASAEAARCRPRGAMQPFDSESSEGVGLVCGFFHFRPGLSSLLLEALPPWLVLRVGEPGSSAARRLFELILEECALPQGPSAYLLERLSHLLFLYVLREQGRNADNLGGLLGLARHPQFVTLLEALITSPEQPWTLERMAELTGLSRSAFCKRFQELAGTSPAPSQRSMACCQVPIASSSPAGFRLCTKSRRAKVRRGKNG